MDEPSWDQYRPEPESADTALLPTLMSWGSTSLVCTTIWAVTGGGHFWPVWVMLGLGIPVVWAVTARLRSGGSGRVGGRW